MAEKILEYFFKALLFSFRTIMRWPKTVGANEWSCVEGTVTVQPTASTFLGGIVEVVYSYRFQGELYTGFHEEPFLRADSVTEYIERFSNGQKFVLRVKPNEPEISIVREKDQAIGLAGFKGEGSRL